MQQIVDWLEKLGVSGATRASRMKLASFLLGLRLVYRRL
jgi:hypothetical protein